MKNHLFFKIISFCLSFVLALSLFACGDSSQYRDDVKTATLAQKVKDAISSEEYFGADEDFFRFHFANSEAVDDYAIFFAQSSTDINEFGIFHVADASDVGKVKALAESYISDFRENWMTNYLAQEYPKVEAAGVNVFGNYVVYTILTKEDLAKVSDTLRTELAK